MRNTQDKRIGLSSKTRPITATHNSNQWVSSPKQRMFVELWLSPSSNTFGNAYQSAIESGYSSHYSKVITARHTGLEWVREARRNLTSLQPEHIVQQLQDIAINSSQTSVKLTALDKLAKIHGMYARQPKNDISVTFINTVPRPESE